MRILGILLVLLGGLTLGYEGFQSLTWEPNSTEVKEISREYTAEAHVPPVVSGIAVVSGLLLLATGNRRDES